ncbi:hypothetical protein LP420_03265 [Massilia sp. B-10]|nr:hypothetical protein LP420_03265 [Massilia sp. B-10]
MAARSERDDAATDELNTSKLLNGRFQLHDVQLAVLRLSAQGSSQRRLSSTGPCFTVRQFDTYCALPPKGKLEIDKVNCAIQALQLGCGEMQAIYDRYRPSR